MLLPWHDVLPRTELGEGTIAFGELALAHSMVSPIEGSVLSNNSALQLYSGLLHAESWQMAIFPPEMTANCIRLESVPRGRGVAEPSTLSNLLSRVRIYVSVPSLLPNSICTPLPEIWTVRIERTPNVLYLHINQHTLLRDFPPYNVVMSSPRIHRPCAVHP